MKPKSERRHGGLGRARTCCPARALAPADSGDVHHTHHRDIPHVGYMDCSVQLARPLDEATLLEWRRAMPLPARNRSRLTQWKHCVVKCVPSLLDLLPLTDLLQLRQHTLQISWQTRWLRHMQRIGRGKTRWGYARALLGRGTRTEPAQHRESDVLPTEATRNTCVRFGLHECMPVSRVLQVGCTRVLPSEERGHKVCAETKNHNQKESKRHCIQRWSSARPSQAVTCGEYSELVGERANFSADGPDWKTTNRVMSLD